MKSLLEILPLFIWAGLWIAGGWMLAASVFRLRRGESAMIGLGLGLILQTWLANLLAHVLPVNIAFWLSPCLVFAGGLLAQLAIQRDLRFRFSFSISHWLLLGVLVLLFNAIGRGLGIFDDYQNLPTVSLMATGDVPPHFALNPSLNFGYHYLLLLFAAQVMRLGHMFPWSALDLTRALILALPLLFVGFWAFRVTHNRLASFLTAFMLAFSGGARWLLLLLPQPWFDNISKNITLIGSGAVTAPTLAQAMLVNWKIDGAGPIPFPFAFYTGVNQPYIMAYTGISGSAILILLLLLLTANRRRHWSAGVIITALISALAIANEVAFGLIGVGFVVVIILWMISNRSWKLPRQLIEWIGILGAAGFVAIFQGGMLTEIVRAHFVSGLEAASYFDVSPTFLWPPSVISAHLGALSVFNPSQLTAALAEIGPIVLVTPLVFIWAWKSFKLQKWFEAALIFSSLAALPALFVTFKGPLFTATPRLMGGWFFACILYAVPLLWIWTYRRNQTVQAGIVTLGFITTLSGLVLFAIQLIAVQKPIYATFITPMDAKMSQEYWNKLPADALIFDPSVFRTPTVFGRFTNSSPTWYLQSLAWEALVADPDPFKIHAAGFDYMYFDIDYWNKLTSSQQTALANGCVKLVAQVDGIHSEQDYTKDFRRLLNISNCK
ncbi:MAG TPA: hypothetical protein VHM28_01210 [Anaerolineales bacterium]|nr:hypothetical protein [Anaerolineales bacterium]